MPCESVIVVGGGLAGLSSAVALAESGLCLRLLEKRPYLGGRATSYMLPDGSHVDNCQHVTMGCCTNLADFYCRAGVTGKIRHYDTLTFADGAGKRSQMHASSLPPPFHLAPSFLRFGSLRWRDKYCIARLMLQIARSGGVMPDADGVSMLDWLRLHGQTETAITIFWETVLVSALSERLSQTDARYGVEVFWKGFLANRSGYTLGIPSVPLADLYDGCRENVENRGGEVCCRTGVKEILIEDGMFTGIKMEDGELLQADAAILAVPHEALLALLPREVIESSGELRNLRELTNSPITSVHLWFDRRVMDEPFLTVLNKLVQWVFNKSLLSGSSNGAVAPAGSAQYLQVVISASHELVQRPRQEILAACVEELSAVLPAVREARLVKGTVIKEVAAVFSPFPGVDRWRTGPESAIANLWLAGDWTHTGWPATMEGAVRSGYQAAEALLKSCGKARTFLQPDLPAEGFSKRWAEQARRN
jgi:squalene-associated FAD-dependent desaturase